MDNGHTCGRREAVEECGEQPREPRGKRARQNGLQGREGDMGARDNEEKRKQVQHPQQQQQRQQQAQKCVCSSAPTTGVFQLKELVTKVELLFPDDHSVMWTRVALSFSVILVPVFMDD